MEIIFDETRPIYLQIKQRICTLVLRGEYKAGDKLPGVIEAAMQYKVNHNTIQRVYQDLIREGVAVSRRGEGTFVTTDAEILGRLRGELQDSFVENFVRQMRQFGYDDAHILQIVRDYVCRNQNQ